jgi:diphthamide synthase (EF-2-diphthine--ammonia ligase)
MFSGSISIFAVALPDAVATENLAARLGLQLRYPSVTTRLVGDELVAGVEGYVSTGAIDLQVAAYSFDRGGRHLAVSILAPVGGMDDAKKLSEVILETLR